MPPAFFSSTLRNSFTATGPAGTCIGKGACSPSLNVCDHFMGVWNVSMATVAIRGWHPNACIVMTMWLNGPVLSGGDVHVTLLHRSLKTHVPLLPSGCSRSSQCSPWRLFPRWVSCLCQSGDGGKSSAMTLLTSLDLILYRGQFFLQILHLL